MECTEEGRGGGDHIGMLCSRITYSTETDRERERERESVHNIMTYMDVAHDAHDHICECAHCKHISHPTHIPVSRDVEFISIQKHCG